MVTATRQSFQIFKQITWLQGNNRACIACITELYRYQILHYLISIIKFLKNQSITTNFILTTQATLI